MTALKIKINGAKTVQRLVQKERKACRQFDGAEIKDFERKTMATCHMHRKSFIQSCYSRNHWSKMAKEVSMERRRCVSLQRQDKI